MKLISRQNRGFEFFPPSRFLAVLITANFQAENKNNITTPTMDDESRRVAEEQRRIVREADRDARAADPARDDDDNDRRERLAASVVAPSAASAALRTPHGRDDSLPSSSRGGLYTPSSRRSLGGTAEALDVRLGDISGPERQSSPLPEQQAAAELTNAERSSLRPNATRAADRSASLPSALPQESGAEQDSEPGESSAPVDEQPESPLEALFAAVASSSKRSLIEFLLETSATGTRTREEALSVVKTINEPDAQRLFERLYVVLDELDLEEEENDDVLFLRAAACLTVAYLDGLTARNTSSTANQPSKIIDEVFDVAKMLPDQVKSLHGLDTEEATHTFREIVNVFERLWHGNFADTDTLVEELKNWAIPKLLLTSLGDIANEKDVEQLYSLRSTIDGTDFDDELNADLENQLLSTAGSELFLRNSSGRKFIRYLFTVDRTLADDLHLALKKRMINAEEDLREICADIYYGIFKSAAGHSDDESESDDESQPSDELQDEVDGADEAASPPSFGDATAGGDGSNDESQDPTLAYLSQIIEIEYNEGESLGFELDAKMLNQSQVFVAVRTDESNEKVAELREHGVLVKVNGIKLLNYVGPAIPPEGRASALTSSLDNVARPMTLTFRRFPETTVFSDPQQAPAPSDDVLVDFTHPIPIGATKLLPDEDDEGSRADDEIYIMQHSVAVVRCYVDGTALVQYIFPRTRNRRVVQQEELEDLPGLLDIPAHENEAGRRIVGAEIPAFCEDRRARRTKKRRAAANAIQQASAEDTSPPTHRHRWKLPLDAYLTSGRVENFGVVLSEVSDEARLKHENFAIRSYEGDVLDPPSGDVRWGFLLDNEMVRDPGTPQHAQPGVPLYICGAVSINGHAYVRRDRRRCICKRNNAKRKNRCTGEAEVVDGHCRIIASHTAECILASLIEGRVVDSPEEREAANIEILQCGRGIFVPSSVSLLNFPSYFLPFSLLILIAPFRISFRFGFS